MELGLVHSVDINHQMQQAYLDYAMSVIVARALPDARDGLKPVHRRILYAMHDMGLHPGSAYKKSARIVGEVLGKYHPHGDAAVYESMARMAQDFSLRTLLVDGQGNFGSVDGDPPAAMRYTEARLTAPAAHLLADIAKNTVNFADNFDGSLQEPEVLPAAFPNLLVNGATGIAVGMSTSIPPHNLGEVVDALRYMLHHWEKLDDLNVEDLMKFIQGPDFPTGGILVPGMGDDDLKSVYGSGRGHVILQARLHTEEMERGRSRIIVTELPYMVNKAALIERIAELTRDEKLVGISDLRDESDRHGLRIVIELSKTAEAEKVLQDLYRLTPLRDTFNIILLALVDGEPRMLSLKQALRVYLDHRLLVIQRRSEYDLEKARQRAHILEGYLTALKNIDEIIALIRKAPDAETARARLVKQYPLSEAQAQAILELQLRRLAALERKKIEDEYKEVQAQIKSLESLLGSPKLMRQLCADELAQIKELYGDRRRTVIAGAVPAGAVDLLQTLPDGMVWVSVSAEGLLSRTADDKPLRLSGAAAPLFTLPANTRHVLYLCAQNGDCATVPVQNIPEAEALTGGNPYWKIAPLPEPPPGSLGKFGRGEEEADGSASRLVALFALPPKDSRQAGQYVLTCTRQGLVKKTDGTEVPGPSSKPFPLVKVNESDALGWVCLTDGKADLLLATADGMTIRFSEEEVRPMGLAAAGVGGIKLGLRDEVVGAEVIADRDEVLLATSDGKTKRCPADQFPRQGRYGQGVVAWKLPRSATVVGLVVGEAATRLTLHFNKLAPKSIRLEDAPLQTRAAVGKDSLGLKAGVQVLGLRVAERREVKTERSVSKGERSASKGEGGASKGEAGSKRRAAETPSAAEKTESAVEQAGAPAEKKPAAGGKREKKNAAAPELAAPAAPLQLELLAGKDKSPAPAAPPPVDSAADSAAKPKPARRKSASAEPPAAAPLEKKPPQAAPSEPPPPAPRAPAAPPEPPAAKKPARSRKP